MTTFANVAIERDEFASDEFIDKTAALPTVIVLNAQHNYGYFIPVSTMAKCGWINFDESQLVEHVFSSGDSEQGVLIQNPRMLVCPKTDLYQYDAKASEEQKTKVIVGLYNAELKNDPNIKTERLYLVFFLDDNNNPLHSLPLKYGVRGVNGATFEQERRAFRTELQTCHAINNQIGAKPKTDRFHSLGVFCFATKSELAGDKKKNWVCRVMSHEKPTTENWKNYFIGYTTLKDYAWETLEPGQKIDVLTTPALAGGEAMTVLPAARGITQVDEVNARDSLFWAQAEAEAAIPVGFSTVTINASTGGSGVEASVNPDIPF